MAINDRVDNIVTMLKDPEEDLKDALGEYIWAYYRNYSDATELEPEIVAAMVTLLGGVSWHGGRTEVEEIIFRTERDINSHGGVRGDDGTNHKVNTLPGYKPEDYDAEWDED